MGDCLLFHLSNQVLRTFSNKFIDGERCLCVRATSVLRKGFLILQFVRLMSSLGTSLQDGLLESPWQPPTQHSFEEELLYRWITYHSAHSVSLNPVLQLVPSSLNRPHTSSQAHAYPEPFHFCFIQGPYSRNFCSPRPLRMEYVKFSTNVTPQREEDGDATGEQDFLSTP